MRKIGPGPIAAYLGLVIFAAVLAIVGVNVSLGLAELGRFHGVTYLLAFVVLFYLLAILVYRISFRLVPLETGELTEGSRGEFAARVNILFYTVIFNSLIGKGAIPVVIMRPVNQLLGARLGDNSYCGGKMLDPLLITAGKSSILILGQDCVVYAYVIEGRRLALMPVQVGDDVTVAAIAIIKPDVQIGNGAIVAAGAVVSKGTPHGFRPVKHGGSARSSALRGPAMADANPS